MNLSIMHTIVYPLPLNYRSALADPNWKAAMADEYQALIDNGTWRLVPRPPDANIVRGKWIFKQSSMTMDQGLLGYSWLLAAAARHRLRRDLYSDC
jgi:hypothetical protein